MQASPWIASSLVPSCGSRKLSDTPNSPSTTARLFLCLADSGLARPSKKAQSCCSGSFAQLRPTVDETDGTARQLTPREANTWLNEGSAQLLRPGRLGCDRAVAPHEPVDPYPQSPSRTQTSLPICRRACEIFRMLRPSSLTSSGKSTK